MFSFTSLLYRPRVAKFRKYPLLNFSRVVNEDEIERKFRLSSRVRTQLLKRSTVERKRIEFTDKYFDTNSFSLTRKDCWLRRRDAIWELKSSNTNIDSANQALVGIDYYRESRDWSTISAITQMATGVNLKEPFPLDPNDAESWLQENGVFLFANVKTSRERHQVKLSKGQQVRLDLDSVIFLSTERDVELSRYDIGEIELIDTGGNMSASEAIKEAFTELGIDSEPVRGKLLELLFRHRPAHYEALRESGLLTAKLGKGNG